MGRITSLAMILVVRLSLALPAPGSLLLSLAVELDERGEPGERLVVVLAKRPSESSGASSRAFVRQPGPLPLLSPFNDFLRPLQRV